MARKSIPQIREVGLGNYGPFESLLERLRSVFEDVTVDTADSRIFVDLFPHGTLAYHVSNLLVAKYLAIHTGKKLVGVTSDDPLFIRTVWDRKEVFRLARAFGVKEIINLQRLDPHDGYLEPEISEALDKNLNDFTERVELEAGSGRYYGFEDRIRRRYLVPTLRQDFLNRNWLKREYLNLRKIRHGIDQLGIRSSDYLVCGHIEYDPYKSLGLACIRSGGSVIYNWALQPFTLKRFDDEEAFLRQNVSQSKDIFDDAFEKISKRPETFKTLATLYKSSLRRVRPTLVGDRKNSPDSVDGVNDKRSVVLMAQALSDGVHSYGPMLYADFSDWLHSSIKSLTDENTAVCLRDHPMQDSYDQTNFGKIIADHYGNHSKFVYNDGTEPLNINSFTLAVTTQGTPGIELPIDGIRTVAVGAARYSGYGLVDEPTSVAEYEALLNEHTVLDPEAAQDRFNRAALFGYMELFCFRGTSRMLAFGLKGKPSEFLRHFLEMVSLEAVFSDPLFTQVGCLVGNGDQISNNLDSLDLFRRGTSRAVQMFDVPEMEQDWWRSSETPAASQKPKQKKIPEIKAKLELARLQKADTMYARAVYSAFFDRQPPQQWLLGAHKCLGRPWGRGRLVRHAFDAWAQQTGEQLSWKSFRAANAGKN